MRRRGLVGCLLGGLLAPMVLVGLPAAADTVTAFTREQAPGPPFLADEAAGGSLALEPAGRALWFTATPASGTALTIVLEPPVGREFTLGSYPTWDRPTETQARLQVGSGCDSDVLTGVLQIRELTRDATGAIASLAATYRYCEVRYAPQTFRYAGELRWRAQTGYALASLAPDTVDFGTEVAGRDLTRTITLSSRGRTAVTIGAAAVRSSTEGVFAVTDDGCAGRTLAAGTTCSYTVHFRPSGNRYLSGDVVHATDSARGEVGVRLLGRSVTPPGSPVVSLYPGVDGVGLQWLPPTDTGGSALREYHIYRADGDGPFARIATVPVPPSASPGWNGTYVDRTAPTTGRRSYQVSAVTVVGEGERSSAQAVTPVTSPPVGPHTVLVQDAEPRNSADVTYFEPYGGSATGFTILGYRLGRFSVGGTDDGRTVNATLSWPSGEPLAPGLYETGINWPDGLGVQFSLGHSICFQITGNVRMRVHELAFQADGRPHVVAVDFAMQCRRWSTSWAHGSLRYRSTVDFTAGVARPDHLDFGSVPVGTTSATKNVTVTNRGSLPLATRAAGLSGGYPAEWRIAADGCAARTLAPGAACTVSVAMHPTGQGQRPGLLTIPDSTVAGSRRISLAGQGVLPPEAPRDAAATSFAGRLRVSWNYAPDGGSPITHWNIYRGTSPTSLTKVAEKRFLAAFDDRGLTPGRVYHYAVTAVNAVGESPRSATVSAVPLARELLYVDTFDVTNGLLGLFVKALAAPSGSVLARDVARAPAMSPDGARVAYASRSGSSQVLYTRRADLADPARALTSGAVHDDRPSWSADGRSIAFVRGTGAGRAIWTVDSGGRFAPQPVAGGVGASDPSWLPDGRLLVVDTAVARLLLADPATGRRSILAGSGGALAAEVSPSGTEVAFTRREGTDPLVTSVQVIPVGGGTPRRLVAADGLADSPTWSPDGGAVFFDRLSTAGARSVRSVRLDGTGLVTVASGSGAREPAVHDALPPPRPAVAPATQVAADFSGDGKAEPAVFRPSRGTWHIAGVGGFSYGGAGDVPVPADYVGDRRAEAAVYRPATGTWYVRGRSGVPYGRPTDRPVPADYTGDGRADIAVYRPETGEWFVRGLLRLGHGRPADVPVPADYTGDRRADVAVYRPSTGTWYVRGLAPIPWGTAGDVPVVADFTGDGRADPAVFRPSTGTLHVRNLGTLRAGQSGDVPLRADVTGDGRADPVVWRPSTGEWLRFGAAFVRYGGLGDTPV